jgi:periplasmic protein TonB
MDATMEFTGFDRREWLRWSLCFIAVVALHTGGALTWFFERDRGEITDVVPAVMMDFAVQPTMDAPVRDVAPGIEQVQTEAAPPPAEAKPEPIREVEVEKPVPVRVAEARVEQVTEVKPVEPDPVPVRELPAMESEITLASNDPPPPAEVKEVKEAKETEKPSELQPSPPLATASETTAPTAASVNTASLVSWQKRLSTHLQRYKRYPPAASARGQHGTAELRFTVDRSGHVLSARIERGSGHPLLDEETLALIQRAQPLPRPPADVGGKDFSFTVPVRFNAK